MVLNLQTPWKEEEMRKLNAVWLRSAIGLLFVYSITLVHANTFAAEPEAKAEGVSFEVLNPEAEWIMPSEISLIAHGLRTCPRRRSDCRP
jgi:hypothetical protein